MNLTSICRLFVSAVSTWQILQRFSLNAGFDNQHWFTALIVITEAVMNLNWALY